MSRIGTCRVCHAPVFWDVTEYRRPIPLDPEPVFDLAEKLTDVDWTGGLWLTKGARVVTVTPRLLSEDPTSRSW